MYKPKPGSHSGCAVVDGTPQAARRACSEGARAAAVAQSFGHAAAVEEVLPLLARELAPAAGGCWQRDAGERTHAGGGCYGGHSAEHNRSSAAHGPPTCRHRSQTFRPGTGSPPPCRAAPCTPAGGPQPPAQGCQKGRRLLTMAQATTRPAWAHQEQSNRHPPSNAAAWARTPRHAARNDPCRQAAGRARAGAHLDRGVCARDAHAEGAAAVGARRGAALLRRLTGASWPGSCQLRGQSSTQRGWHARLDRSSTKQAGKRGKLLGSCICNGVADRASDQLLGSAPAIAASSAAAAVRLLKKGAVTAFLCACGVAAPVRCCFIACIADDYRAGSPEGSLLLF